MGLFGVGVAVGAVLPADTSDLDAANSQVARSGDTIDGLESELAAAEERSADSATSLASVEARLASANEDAEAAEEQLDARQTKLNKRAQALRARESAVAAQEVAPDVTSSAPPSDGSSGDFDRAYAIDIATDIIEDIQTVDERLRHGGLVSSALLLLSDSYGRLIDAGFPPGVDESQYYGRVTTLQSFAEQAADTYDRNPTEGSARYAVIRQETGVLFDSLNTALGTALELP